MEFNFNEINNLSDAEIKSIFEDNNDFVDIGKDINSFLSLQKDYSSDVLSLVDKYLDYVCDNIKDIDDNVINNCLSILSSTISRNILLTKDMVKFYVLYRLKDLELLEYCDNVTILEEKNSNKFGDYQFGEKRMRIFYNYIPDFYSATIKKSNITNVDKQNTLFNLNYILMISHELGHIMDIKKISNIIDFDNPDNFSEDSLDDTFSLYFYRNVMLHSFLGQKNYFAYHDEFINESRADLFSVIDASKQMNSIFKDAFNSYDLQVFANTCAHKIVNLYTEKQGDQIFVVSPSEKFDRFVNSIEGINFKNNSSISYESDIYNDLLLGSPIPSEILIKILDIAKGNIVTNDLNREILNAIEVYNNEKSNTVKM